MTTPRRAFIGATSAPFIAAVALGAGCTTTSSKRSVKKSGFLGDYSQLKPGPKGRANLVYRNKGADFSSYDAILLDPISVWALPGSKLQKLPTDEIQALINYLDAVLRRELSPSYNLVDRPTVKTMRIRVALTEAKGANVLLNTVSSVTPYGLALSTAKRAALGTHSNVGEAAVEVEAVDAISGERLLAAVAARAGTKVVMSGNFSKWDDVKDAFDAWATNFSASLRELRST